MAKPQNVGPAPWWFVIRTWIAASAGLSGLGWLLASTGNLNATGYTVGLVPGAVALAFWAKREFRWRPSAKRRWRRALPLTFGVLFFLAALGAALYAPSNYDALTYRVPQILRWLWDGRWHWPATNEMTIQITPPGYGWLMAPSVALFKTDRLFALPNVIAFALLPGVFFSASRGCGVRSRASWTWMWLVPAIACFATQAGSIGSDLLPAVYALAALALGLRAARSGSFSDFCLSALAAALVTGVKVTAAPMALPWLIATLPCWRAAARRPVLAILTASLGLAVSFLPTALINAKNTGSWNGDPTNHLQVQASSPLAGVAGNSLMILTSALEPPVCPAVNAARARFAAFGQSGFGKWIRSKFPRFELSWGELATEESSGFGLSIFALLVVWTVFAGRKPGSFSHTPVGLAGVAAFGAYLAKMGSEAAPRLVAAYYPILVITVLYYTNGDRLLRRRAWRIFAVLMAISIWPALILSPARPLWPAQRVLASLPPSLFSSPMVTRMRTVYSVYSRRPDYLAPLKAMLPGNVKTIGFIPTPNDMEGGLWKPYGEHQVIEVTTSSPTDPALALLRGSGIITSPRALQERFGMTPAAYAESIHGRILGSAMLAQKISIGLEEWVLIGLDASRQ